MAEFRISIHLGDLIPEGSALARDSFPALAEAVERITAAAHAQWTEYASGVPLPNGQVIQNRTGKYQRSILLRSTGDFSGEVYSDLPYARVIEEGAPERDLKKMLTSSLKVRLTKDGRRYLIIPFRWNNPNSVMGHNMPVDVARWWAQGRAPSAITEKFRRLSGTGAHDTQTRRRITVSGWRYRWGDRIGKSDLADMGFSANDHYAKRLLGMVNFRKPSAAGGSAHSKYLTFRTMVEGGKGWIAPAQAGKFPARTVSDQMQPIAEEVFRAEVEHDIAAMLGGVVT